MARTVTVRRLQNAAVKQLNEMMVVQRIAGEWVHNV